MSFIPRDYQSKMVAAILARYAAGDTSTLLVAATGTGKTEVMVMLGNLALELNSPIEGRVMVVCPQIELCGQAAKKFYKRTGIMPDIEQGNRRANEAQWGRNVFVVASKQTLCRDLKNIGKDYTRFEDIGMVVIDEAHHSVTVEYAEMINHYKERGAKVLGVTATPKRHDKRAMEQIYQSVAYQYDIEQATEDGYLVPSMTTCLQLQSLDLSGVRSTAGDFNQGDLCKALEEDKVCYEIAEGAVQEGAGRLKTAIYCASVLEAKKVALILQENYKIKADFVCADQKECPRERRNEVLDSFKNDPSGIMVCCNVGVLAEGWDFPGLEHIVMGRPTKSLPRYQQIYGRGTRPLEGVVDFPDSTPESRKDSIASSAKPHFKVTDLVDNSMRHKIVTAFDVLGGKYELAVTQRAKSDNLNGGPVDTATALAKAQADLLREEAEARERARLAALQAQAEFRRQQVDVHNAYDRVASVNGRRSIVMPFGKNKGTPISELKTGAIEWYLENCKLKPYLQTALAKELSNRDGEPATPNQMFYIRKHRLPHEPGVSRKQAHALIEDHKASAEYQGAW